MLQVPEFLIVEPLLKVPIVQVLLEQHKHNGQQFTGRGADGLAILHDWDDECALTILHNCSRAMGPQSRLRLIETLIPPGDTPMLGKLLDLEMLVICGGRECGEAEYQALLAAAGFTYLQTIPTLAPLSILESR